MNETVHAKNEPKNIYGMGKCFKDCSQVEKVAREIKNINFFMSKLSGFNFF